MPKDPVSPEAAPAAINFALILEGLEQHAERIYSLASLCYPRAASGDDPALTGCLDQLTTEAGDNAMLKELRAALRTLKTAAEEI